MPNPKDSIIKKWGQGFLVLLFLYFVTMMIVLGNGSSFAGRYLYKFFIPIANSISLNTTWNFFSPDPANTMYLKYRIYFQDEYGNMKQDMIEKDYPEDIRENSFRMDRRRLTYQMRFMIADPRRVEYFFAPWLCRQYPGATSVQTEIELYRIPALDVVSTLSSEQYQDFLKREDINAQSFNCP